MKFKRANVVLMAFTVLFSRHASSVLAAETAAPVSIEAGMTSAAVAAYVEGAMQGLAPAEQRAAAVNLIQGVRGMELSSNEKKRLLALMAAACLAIADPSGRQEMAIALVEGGEGTAQDLQVIVAAIALAVGTDDGSRAIVDAAVDAASVAVPGQKPVFEKAAQVPDEVLLPSLVTEVVETVREAWNLVPSSAGTGWQARKPVLLPSPPPRAQPYEAQ